MKGRVALRYAVEPTLHELGMLFLQAAALCRKPHYDDGEKVLAFTAQEAIETTMYNLNMGKDDGVKHFIEVLSPVLQYLRKTEKDTEARREKRKTAYELDRSLSAAMKEANSNIRRIRTGGDFDE